MFSNVVPGLDGTRLEAGKQGAGEQEAGIGGVSSVPSVFHLYRPRTCPELPGLWRPRVFS